MWANGEDRWLRNQSAYLHGGGQHRRARGSQPLAAKLEMECAPPIGEQAIVANALEAGGQGVEEKAAEEFGGG